MTDICKMFADLTCAIEDLHGIAVEGQAPNLSPDIQICLLTSISRGLTSIRAISKKARNAASEIQS